MILPLALAALSYAQVQEGYLGTKLGSGGAGAPAAQPGAPGLGSFLQMTLALGFVLVLVKTVVPKLAAKLQRRLVTSPTSTLTIEETANFAGGTLYIVRARSKTLLVSAAQSGVSCLCDLSDAAPAPPTFQEFVDEAVQDASRDPAGNPDAIEIEQALSRLERLAR
ncbi:MAG: hypothetical protein HYR64_06955 [Fimbriimonas ginsengisoli]|uniref:Flagellar biosynthetic protein FliO n=1 Tax=Fimbriimonas ginsengisoli TaxID=1005039 RepID=A0A931LVB5_FIMGI|nr:hypothetical protein [Fimbriimonas ginsengisoli]